MSPEEARSRIEALGFDEPDADALYRHFADAEARGRTGHGFVRIEWLEKWTGLRTHMHPERVESADGYERWHGNGSLGYLVLDTVVEAQLADPPERARLVVCDEAFPTGMLGHWTRRLADGGLVAVLTATSPRRLGHPDGGPKLTGTNPISIAIPSSEDTPVVADVSMANLTFGDVLSGRAEEDDMAPFGGPHAHKAFALAIGLQLLVDALTAGDGYGAVLLVAQPLADPVPALRALAGDIRLPGGG